MLYLKCRYFSIDFNIKEAMKECATLLFELTEQMCCQ